MSMRQTMSHWDEITCHASKSNHLFPFTIKVSTWCNSVGTLLGNISSTWIHAHFLTLVHSLSHIQIFLDWLGHQNVDDRLPTIEEDNVHLTFVLIMQKLNRWTRVGHKSMGHPF